MDRKEKLVIIGGNAAGAAAALRARRRRPDLDITIIEQSDSIAAANCSIPAFLDNRFPDISSLVNLSPLEAESEHHLNVLTNHAAQEIDARRHTIRVRNLSTDQVFDQPYHRLILATGARPIRPAWPNMNARGIFMLRQLNDAVQLRGFLERRRPAKFAVIGTGTIAQVCAAALRSCGMEVTMIGRIESLMEDLEKPISERIREALLAGGISLYFSDNITGFKVSLENEISGVETVGKFIPVEGALVALGVEPNSQLTDSAGLEKGIHGCIRVDTHLMTSRQGIYACGDCAHSFFRLTRKPFYWPLATTSSRQGRQAGENASGGSGEDPGTLAARIWRCFDLQIGRIGLSSSQAQAAGFQAKLTIIQAASKSRIYGGDILDLAVVSDQKDGRIIGAQLAGYEGIHARLNALSAAISGRLTLRDLENADFGYTPELSSLWDPVQIAGRQGGRKR